MLQPSELTPTAPPPSLLALLDLVDRALAGLAPRLPASVDRDDLLSVGKLALIAARTRFDGPDDEIRAYCFVRVRGAMLDELRRLDPLRRARRDRLRAITRAQTALFDVFGRSPSVAELAVATECSIAEVEAALADLAAEEGGETVVWQNLPDVETPSPVEHVELTDLQNHLHEALVRLPAGQAHAVRRYHLEEAPLDAIAAELGVSKERARQLRVAGEKRLRADLLVLAVWQSLLDRNDTA